MTALLENLNGLRADSLHKLGILPHDDAYWELLEAMALLEQSPQLLASVHKLVYAEVARRSGRSASGVEKAIRVCVHMRWKLRGSIRKQSRKNLTEKRHLLRSAALHLPLFSDFAVLRSSFRTFVFLCHPAEEGALEPLRPYLRKPDKRPTNSEFCPR